MAEEDNKVVRDKESVMTALGVRNEDTTASTAPTENPKSSELFGNFTQSELIMLTDGKHPTKDIKLNDIRSSLDKVSDNVALHSQTAQNYRSLAPEIGKSQGVVAASIMSPNDLQTSAVGISVEDENLSPDTTAKISELLNQYFNKDLKLGRKMTKWIGDALFKHGATPVMVIPSSINGLLATAHLTNKKLVEKGLPSLYAGMESLGIDLEDEATYDISHEKYGEVLDLMYGKEDLLNESHFVGLLSDSRSTTISLEATAVIATPVIDTTDADKVMDAEMFTNVHSLTKDIKDLDLKGLIADTSTEAVKFVHDRSDFIKFSNCYTDIKDAKSIKSNTLAQLKNDINGIILGKGSDRGVAIPDEIDIKEGDHPALLRLPTESTVPIHVPGSPEDHIGYFVLVDENGNPVSKAEMQQSNNCTDELASMSNDAFLGCSSKMGSDDAKKQYDVASSIFGLTVSKLLCDKLKGMNLQGVALAKHQAVTNCIFQRLLKNMKVSVVFVPANMLVYYAYDYREDGTGKSKLEEAEFILSLRSTLLVADVMAAVKNSTEMTTIELEMSEDIMNPEQVMDLVRQIVVGKDNGLTFGSSPVTTANDLVNQRTRIIPKNLPGLPNFSVNSEVGAKQSVEPSSDLLEKLTNSTIQHLGVPASVFNELGEDEYMRSIATNNLFFANDVRIWQADTVSFTETLVQSYVTHSYSLCKSIQDLIAADTDSKPEPDEEGSSNTLLLSVIASISVFLPPPNMSVDKAQFEELEEMIKIIETVLDQTFSDDLVAVDLDKEVMQAGRALMKRKYTIMAINNLGLSGSIPVPDIDDLDSVELQKLSTMLINQSKGLADLEKVLKNEE